MAKQLFFYIFIFTAFESYSQNTGVGTNSPTEKLEIKNAGRTTLKISGTSFDDTTQLMFSNRTGVAGTDFLLTAKKELGLYFTSKSSLSTNTNDSLLTIQSNGNVGIGVKVPSVKFQINGNAAINNFNSLEFGRGVTKEINSGKIGYQTFTFDALDIVGAGTTTSNRKIHFWNTGGATFDGPINALGAIQLDGDAGIPGQVLTSNGAATATWTNQAYTNNIRFSFEVFNSNTALNTDTLTFTTIYNLNPAMVDVDPVHNTWLHINKTGLYHFSGTILSGVLNFTFDPGNFIGYLDYIVNNRVYLLAGGSTEKIAAPSNDDYYKTFQFSFDIYLTAGQTFKLLKRFEPTFSGRFNTVRGNINGYLIAD